MTDVNKAELRRLTIQRDMMGAIHIKSGEFDYVQIQYQYPYTDNASTQRLAEQVVAILEGRSEVEQLRAERAAALAELEAFRKDAERYRLLRHAHWWESPLCVVRDPKCQVKPGTDCPSGERLDEAVDAIKSQEARNG